MRAKKTCALCAVVAVLAVPGWVYAQDGIGIITQTRAMAGGITPGDAPGLPVTISQPGSFRLDSNLEASDGETTAIEITAANVSVDLNGFSIIGPGIPGSGFGIIARRADPVAPFPFGIAVRNGMVQGMGSTGVSLQRNCRVEGVQVNGNDVGIATREGAMIVNNVVSRNRGVGIRVLGGSVTDNTVTVNGGLGLELGVANPTPGEVGIVVGYANNVLVDNNGGNANPQVTGGIQMGVNICGTKHCR